MPTAFNAANEAAVRLFINHKIGYNDIVKSIDACMNAHKVIEDPDLSEILEVEKESRAYVDAMWKA